MCSKIASRWSYCAYLFQNNRVCEGNTGRNSQDPVERSLSGQRNDGPFYIDGHYYRLHHPDPGDIRSLNTLFNSSSNTSPNPMDPFKAHLVALLSIYELGPFPGTPIPRYEGPTDWQTESILKSFGVMARRMCSAEETVSDLRKQLVIIPSSLIILSI